MWGAIIKIITSPVAGPVGIIVALGLMTTTLGQCASNQGLKLKLAQMQTKVVTLKRDYDVCAGNVKTYKVALAEQRQKVSALVAESAARQRHSAQALEAARRSNFGYKRRIAALQVARPAGPDLCDATAKLIEEALP